MNNELIYEGWDGLRVAPPLYVDMDRQSRTFGWLLVQSPSGQMVTLADLKPLAGRICADRA